jgi:hypothetical protein
VEFSISTPYRVCGNVEFHRFPEEFHVEKVWKNDIAARVFPTEMGAVTQLKQFG